jgi:hypothetical protein
MFDQRTAAAGNFLFLRQVTFWWHLHCKLPTTPENSQLAFEIRLKG